MFRQLQRGNESTSKELKFRLGLRADEGTDLIEMALLTPLLLLLLLGIIEVGRYAELSILVANAARAGAQYGAQSLVTAADTTGIENAALDDANGGQPLTGLSVSPAPQTLCSCSGATPSTCTSTPSCTNEVVYIQVNTTGQFNSLFHYPGIPPSITVNGMTLMRVAQ